MKSLLHAINGAFSAIFYFVNTVVLVIPLVIFSFFKLIPNATWRKWISKIIDGIATLWISVNNLNQRVFSRTTFTLKGHPQLSLEEWFLVISNHQSWVDILVLQRVFNHKIPFLKFFLKKNLIYVPFLGLAWWALDFPFMQRYSRAFLEKHPHLKGKDLETTKKACEKYEFKPVSIMNFVEGTRFNQSKLNPNSELKLLLPPRAGGIAFVLNAMGKRLSKLVNVTIFYPKGIPSYWDFVCGRVDEIVIDLETTDIKSLYDKNIYSPECFTDQAKKQVFQDWMNQVWREKEQKLLQLAVEHPRT